MPLQIIKKIPAIKAEYIPEMLWLTVTLLIPLAGVSQYYLLSQTEMSHLELPKVALLRTVAACMLILLLFQACKLNLASYFPKSLAEIVQRVKLSPEHWIIYAVTLFTISTAVSTVLSSNFKISMWGYVPGLDGYSTYNTMSYIVIFTFTALNLKTRPQLKRLVMAIVAMGVITSLIGFFQHFGINVFRLLPSQEFSRATLTTGNSVVAGSLLLIPIAVTIVVATIHLNGLSNHPRVNIKTFTMVAMWSLTLSMQISAMLFTLSRGPWVATLGSIVLFMILVLIFSGWRTTIFPTIVILLSAIIALSISGIPTIYLLKEVPNVKTGASGLSVPQRFQSIPSAITSGRLNQRFIIWKASWLLISERPWFESENLPIKPLRPIIGYGPEMFRYVFNLAAPPSLYGGLPLEAGHAHNHFIHQAVTHGILGFISSIGLLLAPISVSAYQLILRYRANSQVYIITLCGVIAVASGRFAEQLIGVASISDMTICWILLAVTVCIPALQSSEKSEDVQMPAKHHVNLKDQPWQIFLLTVLSLFIVLFTWQKALIYPVSAHSAGESRSMYESGDYQKALIEINRSIQITPNIAYYYHFKHIILLYYFNNHNVVIHPECTQSEGVITDINVYNKCIAEDIYSALLTSKINNPYYFRSVLELADTAKQLGLKREALSLYEESVRLLPTNRVLLNLLAEEYFIRGMYNKALYTADRSLKITEEHILPDDPSKFFDDATDIRNRAIAMQ
ncbi:MAG: O-antigen ligase family protein [Chloroflexota bacterium]|nr:O-antigen ligase family protein [Chloroflexota bacterium]